MVQFGGQTAIKLAKAVKEYGYKIIGTQLEDIDAAEDRELFDNLLEDIGVERPQGVTVYTVYDAIKGAEKVRFSSVSSSFLCFRRTRHGDML